VAQYLLMTSLFAGCMYCCGVIQMVAKKIIDFTHHEWPFNLLKGNQSITQMDAGQEIEIIVDDPDVLKNLILIIEQSPGYCFTYAEENERYNLNIKRRW